MVDKSPLDLTKDDVQKLAIVKDSPVLYNCIQMYNLGQCSWEQAMQMAAVILAEANFILTNQLADMASKQPPPPLIIKASQLGFNDIKLVGTPEWEAKYGSLD